MRRGLCVAMLLLSGAVASSCGGPSEAERQDADRRAHADQAASALSELMFGFSGSFKTMVSTGACELPGVADVYLEDAANFARWERQWGGAVPEADALAEAARGVITACVKVSKNPRLYAKAVMDEPIREYNRAVGDWNEKIANSVLPPA